MWLRGRSRGFAPALLLALATLTLPHGGGAHHDGDDGLSAVVIHDASKHSIGGPSPATTERPDHCAICHWTRTFRPQARVAVPASSTTEHVVRSYREESTPANIGVATRPPLRAPPSSPNVA